MKTSVVRSPVEPDMGSARFSLSLSSFPDLADHGFQGMVVVPGALYIEMARSVERELTGRAPVAIRDVQFHSPVIISADDIELRVEVTPGDDGVARYAFHESGSASPAATLVADRRAATDGLAAISPSWIDTFQSQASPLDGASLYRQFLDNGNLYGPSFQRLSTVWRAGTEALGAVRLAPVAAGAPADLHPSVLDAGIQLLATLTASRGSTFILHSVARLTLLTDAFPEQMWAHAVLQAEEGSSSTEYGRVAFYDSSGKAVAQLEGVGFSLLERGGSIGETVSVVVAANFTAEPIAEPLTFLGERFGNRFHVTFAPYNQPFQQLLDPASQFRQNRDGINVVLIDLNEWHTYRARRTLTLNDERFFGSRPRYTLPNGLQIVQLNGYETDYVYKEIFEDLCYLKHGIRLRDGDTVVDIGANIGLFSLFVMSRCRNSRLFAFEPAPAVFELLNANCQAYGSRVHAVNAGVGAAPGTAEFTFYENSSVFSGFHANQDDDRDAIEAIVRNTLQATNVAEPDAVQGYVRELTADRLTRTTHQCRITSISEIIREHAIDRIDLLKIDAERSELEIVAGIADDDWARIGQIVMEIHDHTGETVAQITSVLAARGFTCTTEHERLLEGSGLFNLFATRSEVEETAVEPDSTPLDETTTEFTAALQSFAQQSPAPLVVCLCPSNPDRAGDPASQAALAAAETRLLAAAGQLPNVHALASGTILRDYPGTDYFDPHAHQAGHVPFTPHGFGAIATAVTRRMYNLARPPYKVIVLDCDNTLWKGVVGEDGVDGISIGEPYRQLQALMIEQMQAGMLLCLCSKNNERDVFDVFEQRADMLLTREHLVGSRINWNSKADNLASLSAELGLGLDSFVLIDDNPMECAEVRSRCPEVLTLELPADSEAIPAFLRRVWALDRSHGTDEDRQRTRMYQAEHARQQFHRQHVTLSDFINGLGLQVTIAEADEGDIPRMSQLTWRTNQFNFTTVRRSESEIRQCLHDPQMTCLTVRVEDRFGDYGLVGLLFYTVSAGRAVVDTFLLSCRVLGRGVEHAVLAALGTRATRAGASEVELPYRPSEKNLPARAFVGTLIGELPAPLLTSWTFAAHRLSTLTYQPDSALSDTVVNDSLSDAPASPRARFAASGQSLAMQWIAGLADMNQLTSAIEQSRPTQAVATQSDLGLSDSLDARLLHIWQRVLGTTRVGPRDNFFEVGGTSLKAVQVVALIRKELHHAVSIVTLFECPTVAALAARLAAPADGTDNGRDSEAALRGQKRRVVKRQRVS